jgi:hypothetical protein
MAFLSLLFKNNKRRKEKSELKKRISILKYHGKLLLPVFLFIFTLFIFFNNQPTQSSPDLNDGLVGHWSLSEEEYDINYATHVIDGVGLWNTTDNSWSYEYSDTILSHSRVVKHTKGTSAPGWAMLTNLVRVPTGNKPLNTNYTLSFWAKPLTDGIPSINVRLEARTRTETTDRYSPIGSSKAVLSGWNRYEATGFIPQFHPTTGDPIIDLYPIFGINGEVSSTQQLLVAGLKLEPSDSASEYIEKYEGENVFDSSENNFHATAKGAYFIDNWQGEEKKAMSFSCHNGNSLLNYNTWTYGTGSVGSFSRNGDDAENHRILGVDPWGKETIIWEARPDSTSGADGGWNHNLPVINNNQMYRFSTWVKRDVQGNGKFYLGTNGFGSMDGVFMRSNTTNYTNPYFWVSSSPPNTQLPTSEWRLIVAHVWPSTAGTGSNHADSGNYNTSGKVASISSDFRWRAETTSGRHRSYLYYSTNTSTRQQWVYPRVDIVDGTEPSVDDLLKGTCAYVDTNEQFDFNNNDEFSVCFWINPEDHSHRSGAAPGLVGKGHWYNNTWDVYISSANRIIFEVVGNSPTDERTTKSTGNIELKSWSHYCAVYNNREMNAYLNGEKLGEAINYTGSGHFNGDRNVRIGMRHTDATRRFEGAMSDVRIYQRALTEVEICHLSNNFNCPISTNDFCSPGEECIQAFTSHGSHVWTVPEGVDEVDVLVVGGGGGGAGSDGNRGGGGAGGLIFKPNHSVSSGSEIIVNIGLGGARQTSNTTGNNGDNSQFDNLIALGGGAGGGWELNGGNGGSGGGTSGRSDNYGGDGLQSEQSGDSGIFGFGNRGGHSISSSGTNAVSTGGGGAGESAIDGENINMTSNPGGDGLNEVEIDGVIYNFVQIFGYDYGERIDDEIWFAGGGAGNERDSGSFGGKGGGGNSGEAGMGNTGGGGSPSTSAGEAGGSGVVIIKYTISSEPCSLPWGGEITHGQSVTAYRFNDACSNCESEERVCSDGTLSGSYQNQTCSVDSCPATSDWYCVNSVQERRLVSDGCVDNQCQIYYEYRNNSSCADEMDVGVISKRRQGLISHWTLDQNRYNPATGRVTDNTPYSNHGTNNGATFTTDRHGKVGGAMNFNGTNKITIPYEVNGITDSDHTIIAWVQTDKNLGTANLDRLTIFKDATAWSPGIWFHGQTIRAHTNGKYTDITWNQDNDWHLIGQIYDASTNDLKVILDGNIISGSDTNYSASPSGVLEIANNPGASTVSPFEGKIDDVRIYNRALSEDEISNLYDSYNARMIPSLQAGLVLDMPLTSIYTKSATLGSEIITDRTPYSNDGQNSGSTLSSEGASFNGSNNRINFLNSNSLNITGSNLSISAWVKPNLFKSAMAFIHKDGQYTIAFYGNSSAGTITYADSSNWSYNNFGLHGNFLPNNWYHIVAIKDSNNIVSIYSNNELVISKSFGGSISSTASILNIGSYGSSYYFDGQMSNVLIYNRALSSQEVGLLYARGR